MSILPTPPPRQNRTVVLYLGATLAEYEHWLAQGPGHPALLRRVELADSLNWGHLADGPAPAGPRHLHFTPHHRYSRAVQHFTGPPSAVTIVRVRCADCGAVFTILPAFLVRYQRYDPAAIEKFMSLLFITEDSYRMAGVSQAFGSDTQHAGTWAARDPPARAWGTGAMVRPTLPRAI